MSSQPSNQKKLTESKLKAPLAGVESQTEPIMVPFPLPPIGKPDALPTMVSVEVQSDYTWMFNEFPVRTAHKTSVPVSESSNSFEAPSSPSPVLPLRSSPKKSTRKAAKQEIVVATPEIPAEQPSEPVVAAPEPIAPVAEEPISVSNVEPVTPAPKETSKPTKSSKKEKTVPVTPVVEPVVEPPMSTPVPIKKKPSLIEPMISDSSDGETQEVVQSLLAPKPVKLTRVITPVQVRPSAETPSEPAAKSKRTPVRAPPTTPASSSEDEAESPKKPMDESSSSDSDAEMPSIGTLLATTPTQASSSAASSSKKKKLVPSTPPSPTTPSTSTRFGPFVQIDNVTPDQAEYIKTKLLEKVPENIRSGSIKSGVFDPETSRLIVQLRTHPKVVQFMSVGNNEVEINSDGQKRSLMVLSESQKRKVVSLFNEDGGVASPPAKRTK